MTIEQAETNYRYWQKRMENYWSGKVRDRKLFDSIYFPTWKAWYEYTTLKAQIGQASKI